MKVLAHIREQYSLSLGSYGRPRMTMELKEAGLDVGERRVGRLMRINGIRPVRTRKHKVTTDSHHRLGVAANWLDGDFAADAPNQKWAGDITYIWTSEGWLYLAVILDLHSRRVVGWAVSDRMKKDLAIRALDMAVRLRQPSEGCLFHSDRGSQYCSYDYQKKLQAYGLRPSMSGKGNCYDCLCRDLLQIPEGRTHLAAELADAASGRGRHLSVHQWVLQHPPPTFISGRHQPARLRSQGGIMRSVTGTKPLQVHFALTADESVQPFFDFPARDRSRNPAASLTRGPHVFKIGSCRRCQACAAYEGPVAFQQSCTGAGPEYDSRQGRLALLLGDEEDRAIVSRLVLQSRSIGDQRVRVLGGDEIIPVAMHQPLRFLIKVPGVEPRTELA